MPLLLSFGRPSMPWVLCDAMVITAGASLGYLSAHHRQWRMRPRVCAILSIYRRLQLMPRPISFFDRSTSYLANICTRTMLTVFWVASDSRPRHRHVSLEQRYTAGPSLAVPALSRVHCCRLPGRLCNLGAVPAIRVYCGCGACSLFFGAWLLCLSGHIVDRQGRTGLVDRQGPTGVVLCS